MRSKGYSLPDHNPHKNRAVTANFNPTDMYCLHLFPEMLEVFSEAELSDASSIGSYIFHEDFFVAFVVRRLDDAPMLKRVAAYIEHLSGIEDSHEANLAEIGVLGSLISKGANKLAPHLGEASRRRLKDALARTTIAPSLWLMPVGRRTQGRAGGPPRRGRAKRGVGGLT